MTAWQIAIAVAAVVVGAVVGVVVAIRRQKREAWSGDVLGVEAQCVVRGGRRTTTITLTCLRTDTGGAGQKKTFVYEKGTLKKTGYGDTEKLITGDRVIKAAGASYPRPA